MKTLFMSFFLYVKLITVGRTMDVIYNNEYNGVTMGTLHLSEATRQVTVSQRPNVIKTRAKKDDERLSATHVISLIRDNLVEKKIPSSKIQIATLHICHERRVSFFGKGMLLLSTLKMNNAALFGFPKNAIFMTWDFQIVFNF